MIVVTSDESDTLHTFLAAMADCGMSLDKFADAMAALPPVRERVKAEAIEAQGVPEIDYEALIAAAHKRDRKWAQGTNGCIAFKYGAEWFRDQLLASAPPAPQANRSGCTAGTDEECKHRQCATQCPKQASVVQQEPVDYIVSVVVIKSTGTGFNTQNKLYPVTAVSQEEAHGKALNLAGADFPEHNLHTICSYPAQQAKPQPLSDEQMWRIFERAGLGKFFIRDSVTECEYERRLREFARAIEAAHGIQGGAA